MTPIVNLAIDGATCLIAEELQFDMLLEELRNDRMMISECLLIFVCIVHDQCLTSCLIRIVVFLFNIYISQSLVRNVLIKKN